MLMTAQVLVSLRLSLNGVHLNAIDPGYGYYPKPSKTWIVVKTPEMFEKARELFGNRVNVTTEGRQYLGAALGSDTFKKDQ